MSCVAALEYKRKPLLPPLDRLHTAAATVLVICVSTAPSRTQALDDCNHLSIFVSPFAQYTSKRKVIVHPRLCKGCLVACDLTQPLKVSSRVVWLVLLSARGPLIVALAQGVRHSLSHNRS